MSRSTRHRLVRCAATLLLAGSAQGQEPPKPDRLFIHGNVLTPHGTAQAVAVQGRSIVAVGSDTEVLALRHEGAEIVDLAGRTLMPGLYDMHVHVFAAGQDKLACKLPQGAGAARIAAAVRACAQHAAPGAWITGGSWVGAAFRTGEQTRAVLDAAAPNNPVLLNDEALHSVWVNSRALALAGVNRQTPDPQGGRIERDARGEPTGVLRELATRLVEDRVPPPSLAAQIAAVKAASDEMLSYGIVGFTDAAVRQANVMGLSQYAKSGQLKQHARGCIVWGPTSDGGEALLAQRQALSGGTFRLDCVKLFLDGVPTESRTGAMLAPYAALPGREVHGDERGMLLIPQTDLNALVTRFDQQGLEVKFHAAGDAATRAAVDAIASARTANGFSGPRHEIAHNTFIAEADLPRAATLGFAWEFSPYIWWPTPITAVDIARAVGAERMKRLWPIREGLDSRALVVAGSDWPVVPSVNPWLAIETMVTRQAPGGEGAVQGEAERITRREALTIFTRNAAALLGRLDRGGTIEVGKEADLIVLDRDPLTVPVGRIHDSQVLETYIGGERVYRRE
ncbi:amidohydrolase [Novosphingobium piscinae]|uniref:Amidohydrolase n=1 Tax=Novosphingobium piscinae TaxID=1507448 RepID=A0A7X1KQI6_9SPHN|nr:amidohydrolase [Novosphingobium piscinae]MBC2669568.1 amidohydrolase [Novosphingobium piscinae]